MSRNFHNLPDLCVRKLFDYLPLNDLVNIHHFRKEWINIQEAACRHRTSLTLMLGPSPPSLINYPFTIPYQNDLFHDECENLNEEESTFNSNLKRIDFTGGLARLNFERLSRSNVTFLLEYFPSIKNLEIHRIDMLSTSEYDQLIRILKQWSPQLISLTITSVHIDPRYISINFANLLRMINATRWPMLKRISLPFNHSHESLNSQLSLELDILTKVEHFELNVEQGKVTIYFALKKFSEKNQLTKLRSIAVDLGNLEEKNDLWRFYLQLEPEILQKFTCFRGMPSLDLLETRQFYSHFVSLKQLELNLCGQHMFTELVDCLEPLNQLTYFKLNAAKLEMNMNQTNVKSIRSVQIFSLTLSSPFHRNKLLDSFPLAEIFPNVRVFEFINQRLDCHDCPNYPFESKQQYDQCIRQQISIAISNWLANCKRLYRIYTPILEYDCDHHRSQWSIEDFK
ncbi:hypothetical protein BLOT_008499 [Blomia tropicalis]|nr:hypothetical protein BLOT_008499 [Blomia tropicalis]